MNARDFMHTDVVVLAILIYRVVGKKRPTCACAASNTGSSAGIRLINWQRWRQNDFARRRSAHQRLPGTQARPPRAGAHEPIDARGTSLELIEIAKRFGATAVLRVDRFEHQGGRVRGIRRPAAAAGRARCCASLPVSKARVPERCEPMASRTKASTFTRG